MAILKLFYTETGLKSIVLAQRYILMVSHFLKTDRQNLPCMYSPGLHFPLPSPPLNASKYFCMITNPTGQTSVVLTKYPSITTKQPIGFNGFKSHHQLQNNSVDFSRGNSDIIQPYHFSATKKKNVQQASSRGIPGVQLRSEPGSHRKVPPYTVEPRVLSKGSLHTQQYAYI